MRREKRKNRRQETAVFLILAVSLLTAVTIAGIFLKDAAMETDFSSKNLAPSMSHLFGTDWMGRDMFARTLAGLSLSIRIGLLTACVSAGIALLMGTGAAVLGRRADACISWWIDLMMGIPHILLVILISLACGKGFLGVAAGVSFSHWPSLSRVIRGEVLQLRQAPYVLAAGKLGADVAAGALQQAVVDENVIFPAGNGDGEGAHRGLSSQSLSTTLARVSRKASSPQVLILKNMA